MQFAVWLKEQAQKYLSLVCRRVISLKEEAVCGT